MRMTGLPYAATLATALGSGLVAGVFFAFSTFVMDALARLPAAEGIAAMQSINRAAITPLFMAVLLGTAVAALGLVAWSLATWGERRSAWVLAGGALYVAGAILPTLARNVPLNDALATVDPGGAEAARRWAAYVSDWTTSNHVRGIAALAAAALLTVALADR